MAMRSSSRTEGVRSPASYRVAPSGSVRAASVARHAGELAEAQRLRGHDAVQLAAARRAGDPNVVVVAGDSSLLDPASAEGMAVAELP
jgi:predicted nucleic acid-binding protein